MTPAPSDADAEIVEAIYACIWEGRPGWSVRDRVTEAVLSALQRTREATNDKTADLLRRAEDMLSADIVTIAKLEAERDAALADAALWRERAGQAEEVLERIEWHGPQHPDHREHSCPSCLYFKSAGHSRSCSLAAIRALPPAAEESAP